MTVDQLADLVAARLVARARASANASDGTGQIEATARDARPCLHGALPGFSSGISADDDLVIIRRRDGAFSVAALGHPSGEQAGDRTIWTGDGLTLRLRGKVLEVTGSETLDGIKLDGDVAVVRNGDTVNPGASMASWILAVSVALSLVGPTDFGSVVASTTKVKAG